MFRRIINRYKTLSPAKKFGLSLLGNWCFWLAASFVGDAVFYDEPHALSFHLLRATWMACFTAVIFDWKKLKALRNRKKARTWGENEALR